MNNVPQLIKDYLAGKLRSADIEKAYEIACIKRENADQDDCMVAYFFWSELYKKLHAHVIEILKED